jgi:hypothetical protein
MLFLTDFERPSIAKWAPIRDECIRRSDVAPNTKPIETKLQVAFLQQDQAFAREAGGSVSQLIVALYQQNCHMENSPKRYGITRYPLQRTSANFAKPP